MTDRLWKTNPYSHKTHTQVKIVFTLRSGSFYFCCLVHQPRLRPAYAAPRVPSYSPTESITQMADTLWVLSCPRLPTHIKGKTPVGCAEQSLSTFLLRLMEVWPQERLSDSGLHLAWPAADFPRTSHAPRSRMHQCLRGFLPSAADTKISPHKYRLQQGSN